MFANRTKLVVALGCLALSVTAVRGGIRSKAAMELAETLMAKFGARAGRSAPALARRIESLAASHGEEALVALRKVGPRAFGLVEVAGADGAKAVRVLATHGEAGATRVLTRPRAMSQYLRFGENAATALVKHPGVAEGLIDRGGMNALRALETITPRNGRRVAILLENELANTGKHPELLEVIGKHGNAACEFCWNNKGVLAGGAALAVFLANPEPFLTGAKDLTKIAGESTVGVAKVAGESTVGIVKVAGESTVGVAKTAGETVLRPIAEIPREAVKGVASGTNWTVVILVVFAVAVLFVLASRPAWLVRMLAAHRPTSASPAGPTAVPKNNRQPHAEGETRGIN